MGMGGSNTGQQIGGLSDMKENSMGYELGGGLGAKKELKEQTCSDDLMQSCLPFMADEKFLRAYTLMAEPVL